MLASRAAVSTGAGARRRPVREGIERNDVGALGEDLHAVDDESEALPALAVFLAAQFNRAQADALLAHQLRRATLVQAGPHRVAVLRAVADWPPAPRIGQFNRNLDAVLAGLQQHRALHLGHVAALRILHIHIHHGRARRRTLLHSQQHGQLRLLRAQCIRAHRKIGQAVRVPSLQIDSAPDAGGDIARTPVPAEVVGRLAREVADHRVLRLIAIRRRVVASDLVRHCLHARQQGADRRTEHDLQFIVARTEAAFDPARHVRCALSARSSGFPLRLTSA